MSIATLLRRHGVTTSVSLKELSTSVDAIGGVTSSFSTSILPDDVFVQVTGGSDPIVGGRETRQRSARFYFAGVKTIAIEDQLSYAGALWEVRSVTTPGEKPASSHLCHTIVEAEEVLG